MTDTIPAMNASPDKQVFEKAVKQLSNVTPFELEKDWHVTRVLAFLSQLNRPGFEIVFSGGTALSKAHGLLQRFSEDVDFRVIAEGSPKRGALSAFKHAVVATLRDGGFPIREEAVRARDGNRFFAVDIDYVSHFEPAAGLRPHIQVEMAVQSPELPVLHLPVQSLIGKLMKQAPEVARIACMAPVENAADKLSALTWRIPERVRGAADDDPAVVRHIHDLAMLETIAAGDTRFPGLALAAMRHDLIRPKDREAFAALSSAEKFARLLDTLAQDAEYRKEYDLFVRGVSYAPEGTAPDFPAALKALKRLIQCVLDAED